MGFGMDCDKEAKEYKLFECQECGEQFEDFLELDEECCLNCGSSDIDLVDEWR